MWARGLSRADRLRAIERVEFDLCELQRRVTAVERGALSGKNAAAVLLASSAPDGVATSSPAESVCAARLEEERAGSWPLYPFQITGAHGNLYARDLHEQNERLLAAHPDLDVYVARPDPRQGGLRPVFVSLNVDSARAVWRTRMEP